LGRLGVTSFGLKVNACYNWWGTSLEPEISQKVNGDVRIYPWLLGPPDNVGAQLATILGDFNNDQVVDIKDFSYFVRHYGGAGLSCDLRCDLNFDSIVDFSDFSIFAANFGARERAKMAAILGLQGFKLQDQPVVLLPNQPNPFNQETVISYCLQSAAEVQLIIYNSLGQEVCVLADEPQGFGRHQVLWDGQDNEGRPVASGVYFCRLKAGKTGSVRRMALIR